MKSNIFIPKIINVGFQNRSDTYTKKLAYIIYYDNKNKLRKEASWNSWRDEKIDPMEYANEPTSGFVLNKKVGDYVSDWNHRQAYVRVYDPRDFEFEITIKNLLYILENTSSIKGKGLEGDFVYAWDGKDLVLLPTSSPDYSAIKEYNEKIHSNNFIKAKDLIVGATYRTKQNEEWVYMGRFDYWKVESERVEMPPKNSRLHYSYEYIHNNINKGKHHYFVNKDYLTSQWGSLHFLKSLGDKLIEIISSECIISYAELFEKLESDTAYSPYDKTKDEYVFYSLEDFVNKYDLNKQGWGWNFSILTCDKNIINIEYDRNNTKTYYEKEYRGSYYRANIIKIGTIENVFNKYYPMYKNKYLANGKFYKREY